MRVGFCLSDRHGLRCLPLDVFFCFCSGQSPRAHLEPNNKTLATAEMELDLAKVLAEEKASLALQNLHEEEKGVDKLVSVEVCNPFIYPNEAFELKGRASAPDTQFLSLRSQKSQEATTV